jgi:carboxyl-terminal processing protease
VEEAIKLIRGKRGTTVRLTIARADSKNLLEIPVVRDVIQIPNIETSTKPNGVFVISLRTFTANSPDQFRKALKDFVLSNRDKLVLDLRGNPGGYLEAAVDMASWFLPEGKVIVREDFGPKQEEVLYRSKGYNIFTNKLSFVVLVDAGSASAAEILSGALQEHGVAKLVGTNTFGKGSVQELVPITEDTNLKVTIARWLTPNGKSISDGGVKPDVEVKLTEDDIKNKNDTQMNKALEMLKIGF